MKSGDRRWLWIYSGVLVLITTAPILVASQGDGGSWRFSGSLIGVTDANSYFAKMLASSYGDWLFRTPYTLSPQRGVLMYVPYLLLGKLVAGPAIHDQVVGLYHLARAASIPLMVFATYRFVSRYLSSRWDRRLATVLSTAGAGLGWILLTAGAGDRWATIPLEFISPESFGFLATITAPHLVLARACLLFGLLAYLTAVERDRVGWGAPLWLLAAFLINPLTGVTMTLVIGGHQLFRLGATSRTGDWSSWRRGLRVTVGCLSLSTPYVLYLAYAYLQDPFLRSWAAQNRLPSPPVGSYLLAYGWLAVPVALGLRALWGRRGREDLLPMVWLLLLPALIYAPVGVQRRLSDGVWTAIVTLTVLGLSVHTGRRQLLWKSAVVALSLPSTILLLLGSTQLALSPAEPAFLPAEEVALFETLGEQGRPGQVAFADFQTANALPAWAPVKVPIGHGPESVDLQAMEQVVAAFFAAPTSAERNAIARQYGIDWALTGPRVEQMGAGAVWGAAWDLEATAGPYRLYRWAGTR